MIWARFTAKHQSWSSNNLSAIPADGSNLATLWFRYGPCNDCSNTALLVCQNSDGELAVFNSTADVGPQWITLEANPISGTGLAFNLVPGPNNTGNLFISYQTANDGLCTARFNESDGWTVDEGSPVSKLSTQAPLAGFTWSASGADYLNIVSTGLSGVTVNSLNFTKGEWTSETSSGVLAQVNSYSAISANDASQLYAFQGGDLKEYQLAPGKVIPSWHLTLPESRNIPWGQLIYCVFDAAFGTFSLTLSAV